MASSSAIPGVKNMMDSVRKCSEMFHFSSKKKDLMPEDQNTTLLDVCKTRWLQRIDALERFEEIIEPINGFDLVDSRYFIIDVYGFCRIGYSIIIKDIEYD